MQGVTGEFIKMIGAVSSLFFFLFFFLLFLFRFIMLEKIDIDKDIGNANKPRGPTSNTLDGDYKFIVNSLQYMYPSSR